MVSRICKICEEDKPFNEFPKGNPRSKDGIKPLCKLCYAKTRKSRAGCPKQREHTKKYYQENKVDILAKQKNPRRKAKNAERYLRDKERIRRHHEEYRKTPRGRMLRAAAENRRRSSKLKATPSWLSTAYLKEVEYMYWLCSDLNMVTECRYHVDHIVPLKGKTVCGLHVPWNLQVLPEDINLKKNNKLLEDSF